MPISAFYAHKCIHPARRRAQCSRLTEGGVGIEGVVLVWGTASYQQKQRETKSNMPVKNTLGWELENSHRRGN